MDKPKRMRRSGPRTFDRDAAVTTAMRLFWRHGYEGVSLSDLTGAIGIAPPSLYAAFGSKAGLYREALDHYATLPGALDGLAAAVTLEAAVSGLLRAAIGAMTNSPTERGCMVSSGLLQCAARHDELALDLAARRAAIHDTIAQALTRWLAAPAANRLSAYLCAVLQGLSVQARDGSSREELDGIAHEVVLGLRRRKPASNGASARLVP